ncbi:MULTISPECIES: tannase/feruloyl esterase family alpha/beta hydrolase [Roseobacteraceae]|uniref:Mono(2-hydroxyethyl) terephthalate hydrolase n=1 Tax=Pseudosulfitobacter pseudonitzschiae TaxID=1402135 RepID=A0A221JW97_9RHOB|nr:MULTISPECIES: tannase/feruloyl esterase family alpha/beta hydrolase [Roseobacteraceae]ASM70963.1 mono(2-hydroxyethyl) terephthalate hydrolase [Pseudosulfitobacter pseudonitzschiae]
MEHALKTRNAKSAAFADSPKETRRRSSGILALATASIALLASLGIAEAQQSETSGAASCDDGLMASIAEMPDTEALLVKSFRQGEQLLLDPGGASGAEVVEGGSNATIPVAGTDLCLVKLLVGPGNPGPEGAPSTSAGIGIEVLLPTPVSWNKRIRAYGNSGWSGTPQTSLSVIASDDLHAAAAAQGFVVATSDNGHVGSVIDPSFAMNPDGSISSVGWQDFSERSLHELAEKTKALTRLYYGRPHEYAYWDGFSTGGRQGLKLAQAYPEDFDGILVGSPAINWTRYHTANLYAQIAMLEDLGQLISPEKLSTATEAAIAACGGAELGFLIDPLACSYDVTEDDNLICADGGNGSEGGAETCLTPAEAGVINKIWYGQTADGGAPDPQTDHGAELTLSDDRLWFGWTRDTNLATTSAGGAPGLVLAADQTALSLQDPTLGSEFFKNEIGDGENLWRETLGYAGLANAQAEGVRLQSEFSHINTNDPDLAEFAAAGGKMVMYQGLADEYIPAQGAIHYYEQVMAEMGGAETVQPFFRFYLIPGFTHSGRSEGGPAVPVPQPASGRDEMFSALQIWVEQGDAPERLELVSADETMTLPTCVYPNKITYRSNSPSTSADSYYCK